MRILSAFRTPRLAALVIIALMANGSPVVAADAETREPRLWCRWDGTAPLCDGGCKPTEIFFGAYADKESARNDQPVAPDLPEDVSWKSFGKDCATGKKARCCLEFCPNGYTLVKQGECKNVQIKSRGLELPVPEGAAIEYKKGPVTKTLPYESELKKEGTTATPPGPVEELKEGPVVKETEEAPYVTKRKTGPFTND
jgi:hypothetical protein